MTYLITHNLVDKVGENHTPYGMYGSYSANFYYVQLMTDGSYRFFIENGFNGAEISVGATILTLDTENILGLSGAGFTNTPFTFYYLNSSSTTVTSALMYGYYDSAAYAFKLLNSIALPTGGYISFECVLTCS